MASPSVINPGTLVVGVDASPPPPMQLGDPTTAGFDGYEVELLRLVAGRLGLAVRFRSALWSRILAELEAGQLDVVCTAATITAERRDRFRVGHPYLDLELVAVVAATSPIASLDELRGQALGVRTATLAAEYVERALRPSTLFLTEFNDEAYEAVRSGRTVGLVDDSPIASWYVANRPGLRVLGSVPGTTSQYGMLFARANLELATAIDAVLDAAVADGALEEIRDRWVR